MKSLKGKGLLKIKNFKKNKKKINYIYLLTPKGVSQKTKLTINFLKRRMNEYDQLKQDLKNEENKHKLWKRKFWCLVLVELTINKTVI